MAARSSQLRAPCSRAIASAPRKHASTSGAASPLLGLRRRRDPVRRQVVSAVLALSVVLLAFGVIRMGTADNYRAVLALDEITDALVVDIAEGDDACVTLV